MRGQTVVLDRYHLKDVIIGKIYFLLVRIKIKHMELSIIRRETTGAGAFSHCPLLRTVSVLLTNTLPSAAPNQYNESETITKFEIMDGAPVRGASALPSLLSAGPLTDPLHRRDDPDSALPGWLRAHADVPRRQQEVLYAVLPQLGPDRRGEPAVL